MKIERFEDLEIWKEARSFSAKVFTLTKKEALYRDFALKDQLRSSSGSIMDNISEGFERGGRKEFIQFLSIAKGSCGESKSQLYRAKDFNYISQEELETLITEAESLTRKIGSLIRYLKTTPFSGTKYK